MRIRVIDAFADQPFAGNPAAVCLLDGGEWPDEAWMRRVAAEMNLSETAFAMPLAGDPEADWALRWFTPTVEVDMCGHATLATAHAMRSDRDDSLGTVRFRTRSGVLGALAEPDGSITMDFPAAEVVEAQAPVGLAEALGAKPDAVHSTGSLGDLLTVFPDEAAVAALAPDQVALGDLSRARSIRGVIATAPADPNPGYDYVSRFFAPAQGIPEDPVTGSAHVALAPYWSARLGRPSLVGLQASARTGRVRTTLHGDRVLIAGRAVTVLDGSLLVPPSGA
jgi:PhzF family phenazine biosynthesis protein